MGLPTLTAQEYLLRDDVYVDYIKSVEWGRKGAPLSFPSIDLNSGGILRLAFDDLDNVDKTFRYEVRYCTKDWQLSDLDEIQYFNGFNNEEILDVDVSVGRYTDYIHYELEIPNRDVELTRSGNYLLVIYEDEDDRIPVITRRFMIVEPIANLYVDIKRPFKVDKIQSHQELDVTVNIEELRISDPLNEVSITVLQNDRWDNMQTNITPRYILGNDLKFNSPDLITFNALKEFRSFDIRSLQFTSVGVNSIDLYQDGTDVLLDLADPRTFKNYLALPDVNGQFVIQQSNNSVSNPIFEDSDFARNSLVANFKSSEKNLSAEYANVIFSMRTAPVKGQVYMVGKFSDWLPREQYRLEYDPRNDIYIGHTDFKQGYYDYMFAVANTDYNGEPLDFSTLEGDWYETENNYTVLVYLSEFGAISDRLIGVTTLSSLYLGR